MTSIRFSPIDLAGLAPPAVIQTLDVEGIISARKADIVARLRDIDEELAEIFLEEARDLINSTADAVTKPSMIITGICAINVALAANANPSPDSIKDTATIRVVRMMLPAPPIAPHMAATFGELD